MQATNTTTKISEAELDAMSGDERQVLRYLDRWGKVELRQLSSWERKAARLLVCKGFAFQLRGAVYGPSGEFAD
jgi:hypothetical protein